MENPFDRLRRAAEGDEEVIKEADARLRKQAEEEMAHPLRHRRRAGVGGIKPLDFSATMIKHPAVEYTDEKKQKQSWVKEHENRQEEYDERFAGQAGPDKH